MSHKYKREVDRKKQSSRFNFSSWENTLLRHYCSDSPRDNGRGWCLCNLSDGHTANESITVRKSRFLKQEVGRAATHKNDKTQNRARFIPALSQIQDQEQILDSKVVRFYLLLT